MGVSLLSSSKLLICERSGLANRASLLMLLLRLLLGACLATSSSSI
jgi:hypothetical protein